jgi:hypothetical protein
MKKGDKVYDKSINEYGIVRMDNDIHNIIVEYFGDNEDFEYNTEFDESIFDGEYESGFGLYCLDQECDEYDDSLILI